MFLDENVFGKNSGEEFSMVHIEPRFSVDNFSISNFLFMYLFVNALCKAAAVSSSLGPFFNLSVHCYQCVPRQLVVERFNRV